jgi:two-component system sensor histidine kinase UhpB
MSLFWRVFLANAAILVAGILVLALTPVTVSSRITLTQLIDLGAGLVVMLVVNALLLRPLFKPLERLSRGMEDVDVLRGGQRLRVGSSAEVGALERAFNTMLERLEEERREAGARALVAQEEERRRVARGLHDEVGQTMTGVLFQLGRLARNSPPVQQAALSEAQRVVRTSLEEVRRIAQELRPEVLDHLGLASALTNLSRTFSQRTGIRVSRNFDTELPELDPNAELVLYRVAQESLTNVARHSGASEVVLSLESSDGAVVLRVVDNGHGFNGRPREGGGLRGIRESALIMGGALAIKPGREAGVEVRLEVRGRTAGG